VNEVKIVMIGSTTVGKSSIVNRYAREMFDPDTASTVGAVFVSKILTTGGTSVKLQIWDTGGSERYRAMAPIYYQGADGAVIVYDVTSPLSFSEVVTWLEELRDQVSETVSIALVGNKSDLTEERAIQTVTAQDFAKQNGLPIFMETSALTGENVVELFTELATHISTYRAKATRFDRQAGPGGLSDEAEKKDCC
jgi:Ras-related protein Rab-5C